MTPLYVRLLGCVFILAIPLCTILGSQWLCNRLRRGEPLPPPPTSPGGPMGLLGLAVGLAGLGATLVGLLVCVAVSLAPLLILIWLIAH